jgi:hypothetical protein
MLDAQLREYDTKMTGKNIITINGRSYDAMTGQPVVPVHALHGPHTPHHAAPHAKSHKAFADISGPTRLRAAGPAPAKSPTIAHSEIKARAVHQKPQKSQTLHRAALKKPAPLGPLTPVPVKIEADYSKPAVSHHRSPLISRFGSVQPQRNAIQAEIAAATPERAPRVHPVVEKALAQRPAPAAPVEQTPHELKEALIRERLAEAQPHTQAHHTHRRRFGSQPRLATILMSSLALLLLAGYLTYINLPNISMRVAATRAGIAANYPSYKPDGYHFAGPITYQPGEVNITFRSNTNSRNFVIKQKSSSWDSQAVLDNYVSKKTGTYLTYQERGLTIYSFDNQAAWVNGGLLYTINGDAPLSSNQLLHIATSM